MLPVNDLHSLKGILNLVREYSRTQPVLTLAALQCCDSAEIVFNLRFCDDEFYLDTYGYKALARR